MGFGGGEDLEDRRLFDSLSQGVAYSATVLAGLGWLLLFNWIGEQTGHFALYKTLAGLTGVAWCPASRPRKNGEI